MSTQDSQSELDEATIAEAYLWDLASDKDDWNQFLKELRKYTEAYVTTRVKEAERLARIEEIRSLRANYIYHYKYKGNIAQLTEHRIAQLEALTTTTNGKEE